MFRRAFTKLLLKNSNSSYCVLSDDVSMAQRGIAMIATRVGDWGGSGGRGGRCRGGDGSENGPVK